jgi:hypothetical protein
MVAADRGSREWVWRTLAERASARKLFVAGRFVERGGRLAELPAAPGCSPLLAWHVAICFPPRSREDIDRWTARVSQRFALDPERVRTLAGRLA